MADEGSTSKQWGKVVDAKIGFQTTSSHGSSFANTGLLEKERVRVQAEINDLRVVALPTKTTAPKLSGRQLLIAHQYTSEAMRNYTSPKPLKSGKNLIVHEHDPMPRGKNSERGAYTNWIDVCVAKGCLMPIVASGRPGMTRMM